MSLRLTLRGQSNGAWLLTRWVENQTKRGFPSSPSPLSITQFFFYISFSLEYFSLSISQPVEGENPFQLKDSSLAQRESTASPKAPKPVDRILGFYILL